MALVIPGLMASPLATQSTTPTTLATIPESTSTPKNYDWADGWSASFPIHSSCNSTLRAQLEDAIDDTVQLAQHARNHLLRFGGKSELATKYFGNGSLAEPIGWYDRIVAADKGAMTFRCDDPDQNCASKPSTSINRTGYTMYINIGSHFHRSLGRSLSREECDRGDRHLSSFLPNATTPLIGLQQWLYGCSVSVEQHLGRGPLTSNASRAHDQ